MEKEFVPYDRALRLKSLGFDEPCFGFYICKGHPVHIDEIRNGKCFDSEESEGCLAPTFSQAFRWFRGKHWRLHIWIMDELLDNGEYSYEEAELVCLDRLLEIVEAKGIK